MDPNPKSHPILSFVMSRLSSFKPQTQNQEHDIENPSPKNSNSNLFPQIELIDRLPHLSDPTLIAAMKSAVSDVAQTRFVLQTLAPRPDQEAVDMAHSRLLKTDDLQEMIGLKAVVQLDEMHKAYEKLLKEAEERLVRIYEGHDGKNKLQVVAEEEEIVNEEVVGVLKMAEEKSVERVVLEGKGLRFLPEEFGKIRGLVVLDLSNNQLEAIPDSIAALEHLQELRASSNLLVSLPDSIGFLLNLKILDVSGNKLKALPDSISNCRLKYELNFLGLLHKTPYRFMSIADSPIVLMQEGACANKPLQVV